MGKRKNFIFVLVILLCLPLAACGKNGSGTEKSTEIKAFDLSAQSTVTWYAAEPLSIPLKKDMRSGFALLNGRVYFMGGEEPALYSILPEGGELTRLCGFGSWQVRDLCVSDSGTLFLLLNTFTGEKDSEIQENRVLELDAAGRELRSIPLAGGGLGENVSMGRIRSAGDRLYLISDPTFNSASNAHERRLFVLQASEEQKLLYSLTVSSADMEKLSDGSILIGQNEAEGCFLRRLDDSIQGFGESWRFDVNFSILCAGEDGELYLSDGNSVFRFDGNGGTLEKLFTWTNMGFTGLSLLSLGDGSFLCDSIQDGSLFRLKETALVPEDGQEPVILTIATVTQYPNALKDAVMAWNQEHPGCTIEIKNYFVEGAVEADPEDTEAAIDRLIFDINAGKLPDMYDLSRPGFGEPLNAAMLARKGYLADLYPYMDSGTCNRDWFYAPLLSAMEINGGLYELVMDFEVLTSYGFRPDVGGPENWTYDALNAVVAGSDDYSSLFNTDMFTRTDFLYRMVAASGDRLVDWDNLSCYFDSDYFVSILNASLELPESGGGEYMKIENSTSLLYMLAGKGAGSDISALAFTPYDAYGTESALVGLPEVGSVFLPGASYGISAYSDHKQACWDFLSQFAAVSLEGHNTYFNSSRANMESHYDETIRRATTPDPLFPDAFVNTVEIRPGIDKMMQDYMGRIAEIDTVYRYDPSLWEIVEAEASRFYGGQLTAQQTAEAIQSRVKIYLAEQG